MKSEPINVIKTTLILIILCPCISNAQEMHPDRSGRCLYGGVEIADGFSFLGQGRNDLTYEASLTSQSQQIKSKAYSLGAGLRYGAYAGMMFSKNIGLELGLSWLSSGQNPKDNNSSNYYYYNYYYPNSNTFGSYSFGYFNLSERSEMISLSPSLRMQFGNSKWHPYTRTGLIIGIPVLFERKAHWIDGAGQYYEYTTDFRGDLSWGFSQSLGLTYQLNKSLSLFAQITCIIQSWAPKKSTMTHAISKGGTDFVNALSINERETLYLNTFSNSYNVNQGGISNPDKPAENYKIYYSYNSISFGLGMQFKFGKRFFKENSRYDIGK